MAHERRMVANRRIPYVRLPGATGYDRWRDPGIFDHQAAHLTENLILALEVVVKRGGADAERDCKPPQIELSYSVTVDELQGLGGRRGGFNQRLLGACHRPMLARPCAWHRHILPAITLPIRTSVGYYRTTFG